MPQLSDALTSLDISPSTDISKGASSSSVVQTIDPLFKDPAADITFSSADGIHFQLQRKYLEINTGAFPGSEFETHGEIVHLTESAEILRVLFGFVHPRTHPDVDELHFELLLGVAEAAAKYEVFAAVNICKLQMRQFVSKRPMDVLAHASKHDYHKLVKEVAPYLARLPTVSIVQQLPSQYVVPWLQYRDAWDSMLTDATKLVLDAGVSDRNKCSFGTSLKSEACYACKLTMLANIQEMKEMTSVFDLKEALSKPKPTLMTCLTSACSYPSMFSKICEDMKAKIDTLVLFPVPSAPQAQ